MNQFRILFFGVLAMIVLSIGACKKDSTPVSSSYVVNGITDITLDKTSKMLALGITLKPDATTQETVTLSIAGLPAGVSATFDVSSGIPGFASILTVKRMGKVAPGTYPLQLICRSASEGERSLPFNLIVPAYEWFTLGGLDYQVSEVDLYPEYANIMIVGENNGSVIISFKFNKDNFLLKAQQFDIVSTAAEVELNQVAVTLQDAAGFTYRSINDEDQHMDLHFDGASVYGSIADLTLYSDRSLPPVKLSFSDIKIR